MNNNLWTELSNKQAEKLVGGLKFLVEFDTDRGGQDYRRYSTNSMESCLRSCAIENQCKAFTHVPPFTQPGEPNPVGICWLKNGVPKASSKQSMISGVKM